MKHPKDGTKGQDATGSVDGTLQSVSGVALGERATVQLEAGDAKQSE